MHDLFATLAAFPAAAVTTSAFPATPPAQATAYKARWTPYSDGQASASRGKSSVDNGEITYDDSTSLDGCRLPAT
ncbi:hypothetical protein [Streptomyces sp. NPDC023588]|uniref:hypothetical protein n=1 Tax=Streptomyces sp. NPDC023588 TaxID=3154907 RepID=UPI0033E17493